MKHYSHYPLVLKARNHYWGRSATTNALDFDPDSVDWKATLLSIPKSKPKSLPVRSLSDWDKKQGMRCLFIGFDSPGKRPCPCLEPATWEAIVSNRYSYPLCPEHADYIRSNLEV